MKYLSALHLAPLDNGRDWRVTQPFGFEVEEGDEIWVSKDTITDLTSTPRILWRLAPPATGRQRKGAVIHDYLYRTQHRTRKKSDQIYLACMQIDKVSWWKRKMIYHGLRLFGWYVWRQKRANLSPC